ncbi:MAG: hypothetical protein WAM53_07570 [Terrimicrobiaceae bacterium]
MYFQPVFNRENHKRRASFSDMESTDHGQIDADEVKDKQSARGLKRLCLAGRSRVAPMPMACERRALATTPSTTVPGPQLDYGRLVFNLRPSSSSADYLTNPRRFERFAKSSTKAGSGIVRLKASDLSNHLACII